MKRFYSIIILLFCCLLLSCSNKYNVFRNNYQFKSTDGGPDYADLNYWAAHPWKHDPSDSIPAPLMNETRDSLADVFFMHPTTYTKKIKRRSYNAFIDDDYLNAKTDYSAILYQASVFSQSCRVFAPRYRQAHLKTFFKKPTAETEAIFDIAYADLKKAFEYYLQTWNSGRPVIIAAHSQGSKMAERLLKDFFENKPLQQKLVVAYIPGWSVPKDYFTSLKMCADSLQTGCLCGWRTFKKGYVPYYLRSENGNSYATNPLTWTTDSSYAPRSFNKGSVLMKFNKVYKHTTDAQLNNGLLYVKKPKFPWSFLYFSRNYHPGDINLYYINIRENVKTRINMFWKNN